MIQVWTSGYDLESTGVGVIQRAIGAALDDDPRIAVRRGPDRPRNGGGWRSLGYKVAQLTTRVGRPDVALVTASPRPLVLRAPCIALVYDLRWRRTTGRTKRWYRRLELAATTRRAAHVLVISERTRNDLTALLPQVGERSRVLPLGPGQCKHGDFAEGDPGSVLLVGSAAHKRNRTMIEALAIAQPAWFGRLICVNLDPRDLARARELLGATRVEKLEHLSPGEMRATLARADVYASLSVEEGFGFPYVEALCAGAKVIAVDQPLTRELLGPAATLLEDGDADHIAAQLPAIGWAAADVRRERAAAFSWTNTQALIRTLIEELTT